MTEFPARSPRPLPRLAAPRVRARRLDRPGLPLDEYVRAFSQGEGDREEALRRDVARAVAGLGALVGSERVQLVFTRTRQKHLCHGQRDAFRVLRAVSSSSFRRSGAGMADSRNAGSNPAGGIPLIIGAAWLGGFRIVEPDRLVTPGR
jgi:hypothetical protein